MQYRQVHLPLLLESQGLSRDFMVRALFGQCITFLTLTSMTCYPKETILSATYSGRSLTIISKRRSTCIVVLIVVFMSSSDY